MTDSQRLSKLKIAEQLIHEVRLDMFHEPRMQILLQKATLKTFSVIGSLYPVLEYLKEGEEAERDSA